MNIRQRSFLSWFFMAILLFFTSMLIMACQPAASVVQKKNVDEGKAILDNQSKDGSQNRDSESQPLPRLQGPKRTVAVGKFSAIGPFIRKYGSWDIGGGLSAMLVTALIDSKQFVVLERAQLKETLSEQELKANELTNAETGPKLGRLSGAQLLVYGEVTEFGTQDKGGGVSGGLSGLGGLPFNLGGALESSSGTVAMDIRIVDTTTSEILESHKVSETIKSSAFNLSGSYRGISLGGDKFNKTPLGQATRKAINKAVLAIVEAARKQPWRGTVVDVDGEEVYINHGSRSGIKSGDTFRVKRVLKVMTDPATGQVLGRRKKEIGTLRITDVQEKMSIGSFVSLGDLLPKRGDWIEVMSE